MFAIGRHTIFKKRIDSAVKSAIDLSGGGDVKTRDIVNYCKINNQPMNDRTLIEHFCPVAANHSKILTKLENRGELEFPFPVIPKNGGL